MKYPKIYLAIDNCFAFKRWTKPQEWASVIKEIGVDHIEASADTELDPLYMGGDYLKKWVVETRAAEKEFGVKVDNLYSGHGTYCTLGLAHTDSGVRRRMIDSWFKPLIQVASELDAGLGFFAHAFPESVLEDKSLYSEYMDILYCGLSELNIYAGQAGCGKIGIEQMYSPHQVPWRITDTTDLLREVKRRSGYDFYFTEDVGHHHIKFLMPEHDAIEQAIQDRNVGGLWLGTKKAYEIFDSIINHDSEKHELYDHMKNSSHMFANKNDHDCYTWLRILGCYSPIIHLQQTNGLHSSHLHFTKENNENGIIRGKKILKAIMESYDSPFDNTMPERCDKIYLTLEAFSGTASFNREIINQYKESVRYWRQYIYQDGLTLDTLLKNCKV